MNNELKEWEEATHNLCRAFVGKLGFEEPAEYHFVCDLVGDVLCVSDLFFGLGDVVDFMRYDAEYEQIMEYYDYSLECSHKSIPCINIKNFIKHGVKDAT